jgi:hypothetical protein
MPINQSTDSTYGEETQALWLDFMLELQANHLIRAGHRLGQANACAETGDGSRGSLHSRIKWRW